MTSEDVRTGAEHESKRCAQCGVTSRAGANFCPECGTPLDVDFLDPFAVDFRTHPVTEPVPVRSRFGILAGLVVLAGLLGLLWVLTDDSGESADDVQPDEIEPIESTTTTVTTTTSRPTTTTEPEIRYVNGTPGPVLEPGVGGTLTTAGGENLTRIDLASGEIESLELSQYVESPEPGRVPMFGNEIVTVFEGDLLRTDLTTGEQVVVELGLADEPDWIELMGTAGPDSVWVMIHPIVYEVGLAGEIRNEVELPGWFWVQGAEGDDLYLESPGGTFRYDTSTGVAIETASRVDFDPSVTVECDASLECTVQMETEAGPAPIPGIDAADFWHGAIRFSPDRTEALVQSWGGAGWGEEGPHLTHVDLLTGGRSSLGELEADLWMGAVWIPDTRWVVLRGFEGPGLDLIAVNTETAERVDIRTPGLRVSDPWGGTFHVYLGLDSA